MNSTDYYDALYKLAAYDTERELFGTAAPLAHDAFVRSLAADIMPTIWFELPLLGQPRFDLHVAYANANLHAAAPFDESAADGHGALLNWYACLPREGGGLALAYDVGDGRIEAPAVHANINGAATFDTAGFFSQVERPDANALYTGFAERLPHGWYVWYFGVHPGRPGAPVRVDCFVAPELKDSYAQDPSLLKAHLTQIGFASSDAALQIGAEIARSPFGLELQFDVLADGTLGPTIGLSAGFPFMAAEKVRPFWEGDGAACKLMTFAESCGMADARWRNIAQATFTTMVNNDGQNVALYSVPVFAKHRVRAGEPLDAKIYLQAGAMQR